MVRVFSAGIFVGLVLFSLFQFQNTKKKNQTFCSLLRYGVWGEGTAVNGSDFFLERFWDGEAWQDLSVATDVRGANKSSGNYRIWGKGKCFGVLQNPSASFVIEAFRLPRASLQVVSVQSVPENAIERRFFFKEKWIGTLEKRFQHFPFLLGLSVATWTGDLKRMPKKWVRFFSESGLLPLLALSGQHVVILVCLLLFPLKFLARMQFSRRIPYWYYSVREGLPLACALCLWCFSGGTSSMLRTVSMLLLLGLGRRLGFCFAVHQVLLSSVAVTVLLSPHVVGSPGYWLSVVGSWALLVFIDIYSVEWRVQALKAALIPLLVIPVLLYFFGWVSPGASFNQVWLSGVWDFFYLPLGFLLSVLSVVLPFSWFERGAGFLERWASELLNGVVLPLAPGLLTLPRPSALEGIAITALLFVFTSRKSNGLRNA